MPNANEIAIARKKLNGEMPNGTLHEGEPGTDGRMIYRDRNAEETRPGDWRKQQSHKSIRDILRGR